jgi:hypothetical protein
LIHFLFPCSKLTAGSAAAAAKQFVEYQHYMLTAGSAAAAAEQFVEYQHYVLTAVESSLPMRQQRVTSY